MAQSGTAGSGIPAGSGISGSTVSFPPPIKAKPCPSCGHCPTCGKGNAPYTGGWWQAYPQQYPHTISC